MSYKKCHFIWLGARKTVKKGKRRKWSRLLPKENSRFRGARGAAPCSEHSDAIQPGHSGVRAIRSAGRTYGDYPV